MEEIVLKVKELLALYGLNVVAAIIILILGRWAAKLIRHIMSNVLTRRKVEETLVSFLCNLTYAFLLAVVVIAAVQKLGFQTTSLVAVIGAAGLAIGFALQGSLANFAAGVMIIIFRPFNVGDYVDAGGVQGIVEDIDIFVTRIKTVDNKQAIVPNSKITGDNVVNYSAKDTRRIDLVVGVSYGDDIDKVKSVIKTVLAEDSRILADPEPTIALLQLGDSSVNFAVRPWVKTADYWAVYFDTLENLKKRFDEEGICIPFPQRDVHLFQAKASA